MGARLKPPQFGKLYAALQDILEKAIVLRDHRFPTFLTPRDCRENINATTGSMEEKERTVSGAARPSGACRWPAEQSLLPELSARPEDGTSGAARNPWRRANRRSQAGNGRQDPYHAGGSEMKQIRKMAAVLGMLAILAGGKAWSTRAARRPGKFHCGGRCADPQRGQRTQRIDEQPRVPFRSHRTGVGRDRRC